MGNRCIGTGREDIEAIAFVKRGASQKVKRSMYSRIVQQRKKKEGERGPMSARKEADAAALCQDEGKREGTQGPRTTGVAAQEKISAAHG